MLSSIISAVSSFSTVGFSGSRSASSSAASLPGQLASALPAACSALVGCASGVDAAVRAARPSAQVFRASAFGSGPFAVPVRSAALVRAVAAGRGCMVVFPGGPCPGAVRVSRQFAGHGSGSWGSVAMALGLGLPVFILAPLPAGATESWQAWCGPLAARFSRFSEAAGQCWLWCPAAPLQGRLF